jgi:SAM-dependent methyltransferase
MHRASTPRILPFAGFAWRTLRRQGLRETLADLASEVAFDLRMGCVTMIPSPRPAAALPTDAVQYQGASPRLVRDLFRRLPDEARRGVFVDYGSGKGRGLLLAAEAGFQGLVGVEMDPALVADCRRNLDRRGLDARLCVEDAARFEIPSQPLAAFLYNPFTGPTLAEVTQRLALHAERHPVWVVYVNPVGLETFLRSGFTVRERVLRGGSAAGVVLQLDRVP